VINLDVRRIFVEKKPGMDIEAKKMLADLKDNLGIVSLERARIVNRYDIEGITEQEYEDAKNLVFSEPNADLVYDEEYTVEDGNLIFAVEYLPGQYDQRADSAAQCMQILTQKEKPVIRAARLIVLKGEISDEEFNKIKNYCINPVESREAVLDKPLSLKMELGIPADVEVMKGFINLNGIEIEKLNKEMGLAMSVEDLAFCQKYFKNEEKRDPFLTEIKVIDTYWSDHCRHTTFLTRLKNIKFDNGVFSSIINSVYDDYLETRKYVYENREKDICLMDIATVAMKELKKKGILTDLDESDEINACSIKVKVDIKGKYEDWLVMFKNETHNHPTEIEPFGGAATCLGGSIRDPLSGRSFVYQAMRVTGSGDPTTPVSQTLKGKLPQRKITTGAASGYSSYGNQIGLATGQVTEIYHSGFTAKRMEIGAVIAAVPLKSVVRENPEEGDIIILLGGRTGRDGIGGATGSSKEHNTESVLTCGSEVQKGNAPTERKIQRLFRNPEASTLIKKCNDFGAGGICVAIGELAPGLDMNLDNVPKKYDGINGTELAISESQERMAVVVDKENADKFIALSAKENLEAVKVAVVTSTDRLRMMWRGQQIVNVSREFLDTNGVKQDADIEVVSPDFSMKTIVNNLNLEESWIANISQLNSCSQKGLAERFDSTVGANTILMPFGGKYQLSPSDGMAAKIPVLKGETTTGTLMSYGYDAELSTWSPFHGAVYAIVDSVAKIVAMGGNHTQIKLTFQEYFERLGKDPVKWGKPFSSLLGAFYAQKRLNIAAIGGKDSMSGTFMDMNVPPTLVSFAVTTVHTNKVISTEFKKVASRVIMYKLPQFNSNLPDFDNLNKNYTKIYALIQKRKILSAMTVKFGGVAETLSKMSFGNMIGFTVSDKFDHNELFAKAYGSIVLELDETCTDKVLEGLDYIELATTNEKPVVNVGSTTISLEKIVTAWKKPLEKIFPAVAKNIEIKVATETYNSIKTSKATIRIAKPRVFIPVFPGTNCEYETAKAFQKAGALTETLVIKNLSAKDIEYSIDEMARMISKSQIIMIPGGFSGGDEPDGSGKFIATAFRNAKVKDAVMEMLKNRDGLILGICNGFQALIKLGLVPYGEIRDIKADDPTLTFNNIGRHVSCMVRTRISSNKSPWLSGVKVGDIHSVAVSHGEGRFVATKEFLEQLSTNGQITTQYVDLDNNPTQDTFWNPNGSDNAIEGITSPDGKVFGKMAHSERLGNNICINVPGEKDQKIFESGVKYYL